MVERGAVVAFFDGVNGELEVSFETLLTDIFGETGGAEGFF